MIYRRPYQKKALLVTILLFVTTLLAAAQPTMSFRGDYWADGSKCEYGTFDLTVSRGQISGQVYSEVFKNYYNVTGQATPGGQFTAQTSSGASVSGTIGGGQLQGSWANRAARPSFQGTIRGTMTGRSSR